MKTRWLAVIGTVAWLVPAGAFAQQSGNPNDPWCREDGGGDRARYCEVREMSMLTPGGTLTVNASPNGGIKITAWDQRDVRIRAKVVAQADTDDEAQAIARQVVVHTDAAIRSSGPDERGRRNWSVSYEISVPAVQPLSLATVNGGISVTGVRAQVDFATQNGGISLTDVGGAFKGRTQNGGVHVALTGQRWEGEGLEVETRNGGISVEVPDGFSAHIETSTVNGRVSTDFPATVAGQLDRRHLTGDLNAGGPPLKLTTTNGGVSIRKK